MDIILELLNNDLVLLGVGALLILFLASRFTPRSAGPRRKGVRAGPSALDGLLAAILGQGYKNRVLDRTVAREKARGNFLEAGRLYEEAGRMQPAADVFIEGEEFFAAATVFEKLGRLERASELYLQAGDHKKAAQVMIDAGKPVKAASLFLERGNTLESARLFGLAGEWGRAAELYLKAGYPLRAAEAFEKNGDFLRAAECHEKHFMENVSFATTYSATAASADHKSALLAGRLYEKGGDLQRAQQIYSKGSYFREAAGALSGLAEHARAAELYMRAEDPESAARAFESAGDSVKAAILRGEVALKQERVPDAARFFQEGQDYLRAAELFESVGMLNEAAGAYEAGDSHVAAAGVYVRAGLKERAAQSYERGGEFETAARFYEEAGSNSKAVELYERAGQTFRSGEAAAKAGERQRAISLLQRVPASDENYRRATEILAELFIQAGMPGLAVERLQRVLAGEPVSSGNIDLYYWLAAAHETAGNTSQALSLYEKIQAEDLRYRDVEARVGRLMAADSGASAPARAPAPQAAAASLAAAPAPGAASPAVLVPAPEPARPAPAPPEPTPPPPAPAAPAKPARFERKEEVGRGPLGVVYRAEDTRDGRNVALRALPAELLQAPGVAVELVADLKAAAAFSHPNVAKVLGLVDSQGDKCVVTEFVGGRTFAEALKAGHKMAFQQAHSLGRVLMQALGALHGRGLVHGSVQPSNVMVAQGVVKLTDLGLGRLAARLPGPGYRAPESHLDRAGDLYAVAAVLYHLLTGTHPRSLPQGTGLPLPSSLAAGVPEAFDKLLVRCLHPRVELRYAAAEDVLRELKDMVRIG
jgi:tetratricopeptide (TPR) repeat protein